MVALADPRTPSEALSREDADGWQRAMDEEMGSLAAHRTWSVGTPPQDRVLIGTRWLFKTKLDASANVDRYKARVVAQGFRQVEGIDYTDVFAPVSSQATLRAVMAVAAAQDLELHVVDFKTAFLNGELEEEVWVKPPPGGYFDALPPGQALKLHKALYGLKQAPRAWWACLDQALTKIGLHASNADAGLYINGDSTIFVLVYVDDLLIAAKSIAGVNAIKSKLFDVFEAHDLGEARLFLG